VDIQERIKRLEAGAFWQLLGMKVVSASVGEAIVNLCVKPDLLQLYGVVHGGVLATLIDGAIGAAAQTTLNEHEATTTVDLQVMYSRAVEKGTLTAKATIVRRGKTIIFGDCKAYDDAERLIVHGSATYMVLEHARWSRKG